MVMLKIEVIFAIKTLKIADGIQFTERLIIF
jgi:hypothetical protein